MRRCISRSSQAGLHSELADQVVADTLEQPECFRLLAGAEQREHESADEGFVQRLFANDFPKLGQDLGVAVQLQLHIESPT